jgi:hypothetical protein
MNDRQVVGTLLIVVSVILFSAAVYSIYIWSTAPAHPLFGALATMPNYFLPLTIIGIVLLIVGIIFVMQTRSKSWF